MKKCIIFTAIIVLAGLTHVAGANCWVCKSPTGPCDDGNPGGQEFCAPGPPCFTGGSTCPATPSPLPVPSIIIDDAVISDLAEVHPRVAMILAAINLNGGVRGTVTEVYDLAIPFDQEDFRTYVESPEDSRNERLATAAGSVESVEFRVTVEMLGESASALSIESIRPFDADRPFRILRLPLTHSVAEADAPSPARVANDWSEI